MKGFINLIKPKGMSSAYAVTAVKKKFNMPCGHMGTLDPMASGVLPVGIGQASRLFQYLLDKEKTYVARFVFGYTTDTLDVTGVETARTDAKVSLDKILEVLPSFVGEIDQIPPKYSAKCIDGKRGYQLARKGVEFELAPKKVTILSAECLGQTDENEFEFKFTCKGGTYIRSLARDIGEAVGSLGVMSALSRTACGIFKLENGVGVEEFFESSDPARFIIEPDQTVSFPKLVLTDKQATKILNGVFENNGYPDGIYRVYNENEFWGVGSANDGVLRINTYVR
ncbi:MAG: tRNA pseudouridine(55) synthase TruB [Clostridia bacterium]|nr:tRNA pseudouridine(55) synthase TruB [Clostridia bacterium]